MTDRQTGQGRQLDRKILRLEVTSTFTFFLLTNFGRFDFGTSLLHTVARCPTMTKFYNTSQVDIESIISVNRNVPNITVSSFDGIKHR